MFPNIARAARNPIIRSLMLLAGVLVLALLAIILVGLTPSDIGRPYEPLEATDSHVFDPLELHLGRTVISYPDGGIMVGAYRRDQLVALVLLAEGSMIYATDEEEITFPVEQVILHMHPSAIRSIRGQTYIEAQILPDAVYEAQELLRETADYEPSLQIFGVEKVFMPRPGVIRIEAFGEGHHYRYINARSTVFAGPFYSEYHWQQELPLYPPIDQFRWSLGIVFVMVLAVCVAIIFLTPEYARIRDEEANPKELILPALLVLAHLAIERYLTGLGLSPLVTWGWRVMVIAAIFWLGDSFGDSLKFYGMKPRKPLSGIASGLFIGILLVLSGSIALPAGLAVGAEYSAILEDYIALLLSTLIFQELFWRGLVQGSLRRHVHPLAAIIITSLMVAGVAYLPLARMTGVAPATLLQVLVILPMTSLILGFTYERTHSLYASLMAASIIYILPRILIF